MQDSSIDCCPCRLEWRPSRWHAAAVALIWPLTAFALLATVWGAQLPPFVAAVLLVVAVAAGGAHCARIRREAAGVLDLLPERRARWIPEGDVEREGRAVVHEQWPVTTIRFSDGGTTLVFWPDTLCGSGRRLLRRWARSATPVSPLPQFWMG